MSRKNILPKLKANQSNNIASMASWSHQDLQEMASTYDVSKRIAIESDDSLSVDILEEKIKQLKVALAIKQA